MLVLGWHGSWRDVADDVPPRSAGDELMGHDAAAVVLRDGGIVAAIEEERLSRHKHSRGFPRRAIQFCLEAAGASLSDLDAIVTDAAGDFVDRWVFDQGLEQPGHGVLTGRRWLGGLFRAAFAVDVEDKIGYCRHHLSHLYAAVRGSGFREALGVCLDGMGDGPSGLIAACSGGTVRPLRYIPADQSLGLFYLRSIAPLGYRLFDEYKVMGMAPYGNPAPYRALLARIAHVEDKGRYTICTEAERKEFMAEAGIDLSFRRPGASFEQRHFDYAAALQEHLESLCLHVIEYFREQTGATAVCLSGGVAQNCSMTGKLLRRGLFDQLYVPPAAHDSGNVIGAAASVARIAADGSQPALLPHAYLGRHVGNRQQVRERLARWQGLLRFEQVDDAAIRGAERIAAAEVIGWVQGRSEFGPRALGNRSILADPRPPDNKDIINAMIKKRESYRPFAPSVLEERLHEFFEVDESVRRLPYMTIVVPVRKEMRPLLGAITHVDGTARVQTVGARENPRFHALITEFAALTGLPLVLNTSFNNNAEPIVDSVDDAVVCFLTTGLHRLIIADFEVTKVSTEDMLRRLSAFAPVVPPGYRLVRHRPTPRVVVTSIEPNAHAPCGRITRVSPSMAAVLSDADGSTTLRSLCSRNGCQAADLAEETFALWQSRAIALYPI